MFVGLVPAYNAIAEVHSLRTESVRANIVAFVDNCLEL
jgi:hypothetical protein